MKAEFLTGGASALGFATSADQQTASATGLPRATEAPHVPGLMPLDLDIRDQRRRKQMLRLADDTQHCIDSLPVNPADVAIVTDTPVQQLARWARLARRVRRTVSRIAADENRLIDERALIQRYRELLDVLAPDLREIARVPHVEAA